MAILDRLRSLRESQETRERAARARSRRNISVGLLQEEARERRIDRGDPRSRTERVASARKQVAEAAAARRRAKEAEAEASGRTPRSEQSTIRRVLRRAGAGAASAARTALEAEADGREARGDSAGAVAARAEDLATAGAPIRGATADPRVGETAERMARGQPVGVDEESHGVEESGLWWENFVMGTDEGQGDLDGDGLADRDPLDFDDPLGLTGGLE